MVYRMFFPGHNFVSGLLYTLKTEKNLNNFFPKRFSSPGLQKYTLCDGIIQAQENSICSRIQMNTKFTNDKNVTHRK